MCQVMTVCALPETRLTLCAWFFSVGPEAGTQKNVVPCRARSNAQEYPFFSRGLEKNSQANYIPVRFGPQEFFLALPAQHPAKKASAR
jgi:hypothetical protein